MGNWISAIIVVVVLGGYGIFRLLRSARNEDKQYENAMRDHGER